jgi:hypothetical protein
MKFQGNSPSNTWAWLFKNQSNVHMTWNSKSTKWYTRKKRSAPYPCPQASLLYPSWQEGNCYQFLSCFQKNVYAFTRINESFAWTHAHACVHTRTHTHCSKVYKPLWPPLLLSFTSSSLEIVPYLQVEAVSFLLVLPDAPLCESARITSPVPYWWTVRLSQSPLLQPMISSA